MDTLSFPEWFQNLAIAGLALAPIVAVIAQIIKIVGARTGLLHEGATGYIVVVLSVIAVAVAALSNAFGVEIEVKDALTTVQRIAEAVVTLLGAMGWYTAGKQLSVFRPVNWK